VAARYPRGRGREKRSRGKVRRRDLEIGTRVSSFISPRIFAGANVSFLVGERGNAGGSSETTRVRPHMAVRRENGSSNGARNIDSYRDFGPLDRRTFNALRICRIRGGDFDRPYSIALFSRAMCRLTKRASMLATSARSAVSVLDEERFNIARAGD